MGKLVWVLGIAAVVLALVLVALMIYDGSNKDFKVPGAAYGALGATATAFGVIATAAGAVQRKRGRR